MRFRSAPAWCVALVAAWLAGGCYRSHQRVDGGPVRDAGGPEDAGDLALRPLDLLLVINDSISMAEEQANLARELPSIIGILLSGDFDRDGDGFGDGEPGDEDFRPVDAMNVAVVTTDMGSGGFMVGGCPVRELGDDGLFRTRGADAPGCTTVYPGFLRYRGGDADAFQRSVACVAQTGNAGCGIEQPFEAALKALSPAAPTSWTRPGYTAPTFLDGVGHGDGENDRFMHENGILAILLVSDDDDCSVRDPSLFDGHDMRYATSVNLRCVVNEDPLLQPIQRYVDGFLQLRGDPSLVVFSAVVGVPRDLAPTGSERTDYDGILADARMQRVVDPMTRTDVIPSCDEPGTGLAYPPVRTLELAREIEARGGGSRVASICGSSFAPALLPVIERLARF
ncbi:MAG: hypothetical protein AB7S26_33880 [Sandaracinaceae bacterium]